MVWTTVANVALPLSAAVTGPVLARALGVEGRGELAAVLAPLALVAVLMTFGLPEALTFVVAAGRVPLAVAIGTGCALAFGAGVAGAALVAACAPLLLHRVPDAIGLLLVLCVTVPPLMAMTGLRAIAQGRQRFDRMIRERWTSVLSRLAVLVALAVAGVLSVTAAAWVTELTALAGTLALLAVARGAGRPRFDREVAARLWRYASRAWVGTLGGILILRLDQVLLTPLAGARQLGLYAVAVSLAEIPAVAHTALRDVVFSTSAARADPELAARATRMLTLVQVPLCLVGALVAPWVVRLAFGDSFADATSMARILFVATVPGGAGVVLGAGLLAAGRPGARSWAQAGGAAATIVALLLLVPAHGGVGAAWASVVGYAATMVVIALAFSRATGIPVAAALVPRADDARELARRLRAARSGGRAGD